MAIIEVQAPCPAYGGGGILGIVSHDMALDAGEPMMEGMPVFCTFCDGQGWIIEFEEVEDGQA